MKRSCWLGTLIAYAIACGPALARGQCLTDADIDRAFGEQVRAGAFVIDTSSLPDRPLCSALTVAQQLQRMRADAFPEEREYDENARRIAIEREEQATLAALAREEEARQAALSRIAAEERARATQAAPVRPRASSAAKARSPTKRNASTAGRSTASRSAYYPNCAAARRAGVAPIRRGQPGYRSELDRDNDGLACE